MSSEKFTTTLTTAFSEAQSIAIEHHNQFLEPEHVLLAMFYSQCSVKKMVLFYRYYVNVELT